MGKSTFLKVAEEILSRERKPMRPNEICEIALREHLLNTNGLTPEASMRACLNSIVKKADSKFSKDKGKYSLKI